MELVAGSPVPPRRPTTPVREEQTGSGPGARSTAVLASTPCVRFEELFAAEQRRLYGALCLITRDPHEAEEIGQEAFARVWERWDRVGSMADPAGYLYRVAMNVLRSRYRRARVAARRAVEGTKQDEIADADDRDEVERMLRPLNRQQRSALVLTSMLGYSSDEAGALLGMRGSTIRVLTTRARAALRAQTSGLP